MILTRRRLIVFSVVLGVFLLLGKVTASFFDDLPTRSSREFEQAVHEFLKKADRGSAEVCYRLRKYSEGGLVVDKEG